MAKGFELGRTSPVVRAVLGALTLSLACMALFVGGVAEAKSTARQSVVRTTDVTNEGVVAASTTATFAARCPASDPHPVGGEFGVLHGDSANALVLAASYPQGRRGWVVTVKNQLAQQQGYYAAIVCVRAKATFAYPRTTFVITPNGGFLNNGIFHNVAPKCPRTAPHPINVYFGTRSAADIGSAVLSDSDAVRVPNATVDDVSNRRVAVFFGAVCTSLRRTIAYTRLETVGPGKADGWIFTCPHRTPLAVSGFFYPTSYTGAGLLEATTSALYRNAHKWIVAFNNLAQHPIRYYAGAVCIG